MYVINCLEVIDNCVSKSHKPCPKLSITPNCVLSPSIIVVLNIYWLFRFWRDKHLPELASTKWMSYSFSERSILKKEIQVIIIKSDFIMQVYKKIANYTMFSSLGWQPLLAENQLIRMCIGLTIRHLHSTEVQTASPTVEKRRYYIPELSLMALSRR